MVAAPNRSEASGLGDRFLADERGAAAVEYAMVAAGVAVAVAGTIWGLGSEIKTTFYDKIAALLQ